MIKPALHILFLNSVNVREMACVKVDGHLVQMMWNALFRFNICPILKAGNIHFETEVVSILLNRIIGK